MSAIKRVAVILCGSGYKDGSEIRESVSTLIALSQEGVEFQCFAPDELQSDVVNCLSGETMKDQSRNMRVEAARIARGDVRDLKTLRASDFEAVIIPGGFGAAKNLCDFASRGSNGKLRDDLQKILVEFYSSKKPMGAICIAPAIVGLAFKNSAFTLTVGSRSEASDEIEKMGHLHQVCAASDCVVDAKNKIVTSPAYMLDQAPLADIFKGIQALVKNVLQLARN